MEAAKCRGANRKNCGGDKSHFWPHYHKTTCGYVQPYEANLVTSTSS